MSLVKIGLLTCPSCLALCDYTLKPGEQDLNHRALWDHQSNHCCVHAMSCRGSGWNTKAQTVARPWRSRVEQNTKRYYGKTSWIHHEQDLFTIFQVIFFFIHVFPSFLVKLHREHKTPEPSRWWGRSSKTIKASVQGLFLYFMQWQEQDIWLFKFNYHSALQMVCLEPWAFLVSAAAETSFSQTAAL